MSEPTTTDPQRTTFECDCCGGRVDEEGNAEDGWPFEWQVASALRTQLAEQSTQLREAQVKAAAAIVVAEQMTAERDALRELLAEAVNGDGGLWSRSRASDWVSRARALLATPPQADTAPREANHA